MGLRDQDRVRSEVRPTGQVSPFFLPQSENRPDGSQQQESRSKKKKVIRSQAETSTERDVIRKRDPL